MRSLFKTTSWPILSVLLLLPLFTFAAEEGSTPPYPHISLGGDLYGAWETIEVRDDIAGDVFIAGRRLSVRSTVGGDVHAAGADITIDGHINDDLRIAGDFLLIDGYVDSDVFAFGNTIVIGPHAVLSGSLVAYGSEIDIQGIVHGSVTVGGENVVHDGHIGGVATLRGDHVSIGGTMSGNALIIAKDIEFLPAGVILGELRYWQEAGPENFDARVLGADIFDPIYAEYGKGSNDAIIRGILTLISLLSIISAMLTIAVFQMVTKTFFIDCAKSLRAQPVKNFIWGLLYFVCTPFIAAFLFATVVGIPLALLVLGAYMFSFLFANVIAAMIFARFLELRRKKIWSPLLLFVISFLLFILLQALLFIPIVGWMIDTFIVVLTFGTYLEEKVYRFKLVR